MIGDKGYHFFKDGFLFVKESPSAENGGVNVYKVGVNVYKVNEFKEVDVFWHYGIKSYDAFKKACKEYLKEVGNNG